MNYLLKIVVNILNNNNIPYYLDCGTLLGCVRENGFIKNDTDIDVTIHLSFWDKLNVINFSDYDLIRTRTYEGYPHKENGNMISVKTKFSNLYCDIYTNPAFPYLENTILNGNNYFIPKNSELYLTQLYGEWKVPSNKHASTRYHRGNGLVNSEYLKYWDKKYKIFKCNM
jgi:phosphorylcholine metabolism protein LicD